MSCEGIGSQDQFFLSEVEELKIELGKTEEEASNSKRKANEATKVVQKIQDYIGNPNNVVNKAKLFKSKLERARYVSKAKVILVLVNYSL